MPLYSTKRFCKACGERKRLTWPKDDPTCCAMWCAARSFLMYSGAGGWEGSHCTNCGEPEPDHFDSGECDHEVAQGGE